MCVVYGVGGKWTRNTRQSVPPLLFTQGPNLRTKISGHKWSSAAASRSHAPPRLLHKTVEKWVLQHSQANIKTELPCLTGVGGGDSSVARAPDS